MRSERQSKEQELGITAKSVLVPTIETQQPAITGYGLNRTSPVPFWVPVEGSFQARDAEITPIRWACQDPCTTYCSSIPYPVRFLPNAALDICAGLGITRSLFWSVRRGPVLVSAGLETGFNRQVESTGDGRWGQFSKSGATVEMVFRSGKRGGKVEGGWWMVDGECVIASSFSRFLPGGGP